MQGKLVLSLENTKPIGIVELDVAHLELGMYLVKLYYDQIEIGNEKLLIVR
jgi:hypothetical protein